jgi:hypothetical protein
VTIFLGAVLGRSGPVAGRNIFDCWGVLPVTLKGLGEKNVVPGDPFFRCMV